MNPGIPRVPEPGLTCEEVRDLLHSFVSNELEKEELEAVLEHLAACEGCRAAMAEHVRLIGKLREHMPKLGRLYFRVSSRMYD
jgi:anti-sigma factor RsiW